MKHSCSHDMPEAVNLQRPGPSGMAAEWLGQSWVHAVLTRPLRVQGKVKYTCSEEVPEPVDTQ